MKHQRRVRAGLLGCAGIVVAVMIGASSAWACASLAALELATPTAGPGDEVAFKGTFFNKDNPVEIRWNALDGPVLTTVTPDTFTEGLHGNWRFANGTFTVPADAAPGNYLVIANQEAAENTNTWGVPARTLLQVGDGGAPLIGETPASARAERPATLLTEESTTVGTLVVVGVGAAGVAMFLSGVAMLFASRRPARQRAEA